MNYHTPKPFFHKARNRWYVQLGGRQVILGPDRDEAVRRYHRLMVEATSECPTPSGVGSNHLVADLSGHFLE